MTSSFKKNELVALHRLLGLPRVPRALKPQLESDLLKYLLSNPSEIQKDERLPVFLAEQQLEATSTEAEDESDGAVKSDSRNAPSTSGGDSEAYDKLGRSAGETVDKVEQIVEKKGRATRSALQPVVEKADSKWASVQSFVSTIVFANVILLAAEYAAIIYLHWPRDIAGFPKYAWNRMDQCVGVVRESVIVTVLPALVVSFVVNFTKKNSIRRKKHVYSFDPVVFGLVRLVAAGLSYFTNTSAPTSQLAGISGLTATLLGIYASILQTP